ncbi:LamG-like jellyroll fold domain-containing protein [Candidatus Neomarinimicrobiota bacterium]
MHAYIKNILPAALLTFCFYTCEEPVDTIDSVTLQAGAYVHIPNNHVAGVDDSTSLALLDTKVFSIEIRASGDILPEEVTTLRAMFMVSNDQNGLEIGIYRVTTNPAMISVWMDAGPIGNWEIPGCNWNDINNFTQVVVTYDGSDWAVYGNGTLLERDTRILDINIGSSGALIGAGWTTVNDQSSLLNHWYGNIDEVRLWNSVIDSDDMEFRYKNPKNLTRHYSANGLDPLFGLWRFNDETSDGGTIPDASTKGNDATIHAGNGSFTFSLAGAK